MSRAVRVHRANVYRGVRVLRRERDYIQHNLDLMESNFQRTDTVLTVNGDWGHETAQFSTSIAKSRRGFDVPETIDLAVRLVDESDPSGPYEALRAIGFIAPQQGNRNHVKYVEADEFLGTIGSRMFERTLRTVIQDAFDGYRTMMYKGI